MTTILDVPPPDAQPAERSARQLAPRLSGWRSGDCAALQYAFDMTVEATPTVISVLQQVIEPFRGRQPETEDGSDPERQRNHYTVRPDDQQRWALHVGDRRLVAGRSVTDVLGMLVWHINRNVIEASTPRYVLLHAAAATRYGLTVILPADQECGKSTTVSGLLREGWDYVTDEAVAIDPQSDQLTPFPKDLSIDPGSWHLFPECRPRWDHVTSDSQRRARQWQVPPGWLGSRRAQGPVSTPRLVVFPKYVAGATTECSPITRADALRQLAQTTFDFPLQPQRNLDVLARVVARATVTRLRIGSLSEAVDAIEDLASTTYLEEL